LTDFTKKQKTGVFNAFASNAIQANRNTAPLRMRAKIAGFGNDLIPGEAIDPHQVDAGLELSVSILSAGTASKVCPTLKRFCGVQRSMRQAGAPFQQFPDPCAQVAWQPRASEAVPKLIRTLPNGKVSIR
jgi:hypothetical protein